MHPRRGDALLAVTEACLDAGLDVQTITQGLGYTRPEHLRSALRRQGDDFLYTRLRTRSVRGAIDPIEVGEMLDRGITTWEVASTLKAHPKTLANSLRRHGDDRYKMFYRLCNNGAYDRKAR